jgi:cell division protein FtsW (lipid II flippase)
MGVLSSHNREVLSIVALILAFGLAVLIRLDPDLAIRQAWWLIWACPVYLVASRISLNFFRRNIHYLAFCGAFMVLGTAMIGHKVNGATAWTSILGFNIQPIEIVKILLVLLWGMNIADGDKGIRYGWKSGLIITLLCFTGLFWQKDLGPLMVLICTAFLGLLAGKLQGKILFISGLAVLVIFWAASFLPHVQRRLFAWLYPWDDRYNLGFQAIRLTYALVKGAWSGQGWDSQNILVPAAANDLPLSVIGENSGFIGLVIIILLYFLLIYKLIQTGSYISEKVNYHWSVGLTVLMASGIILNLAGSCRLLPLVGITLPLLSYGGSSLLASFFILGLFAQLTRADNQRLSGIHLKHLLQLKPLRIVISGLFTVIIAAFGYRCVIQRADISAEAGYQQIARQQAFIRGGFVSRSGEALSDIIHGLDQWSGRYVGPDSLVHTIGYFHPIYGVSGLEATFNDILYGAEEGIGRYWLPTETVNVVTTIDWSLQNLVEKHFPGEKGAVVILNPWSGEVLAMASFPHFNIDDLESSLKASPQEGPLLNRAVSGLYPPGSAIKPFILAIALESESVTVDSLWVDKPYEVFGGVKISNYNGLSNGQLTLKEALAYSSNVVFAGIAGKIGSATLKRGLLSLGIGADKGIEIPTRHGSWGQVDSPADLAYIGIGQGQLLVTPLEMATAVSTIANGGYKVEPYLVSRIDTPSGSYRMGNAGSTRILSYHTVENVSQGMQGVMSIGTAKGLISPELLSGKTGTAENPSGPAHAWFVGYAPSVNPVIAIAIVIENGGSGKVAAAMAANIVKSMVIEDLLRTDGEQVGHDWESNRQTL